MIGEVLSDEVGLKLSPETLVSPGDRKRGLRRFQYGCAGCNELWKSKVFLENQGILYWGMINIY